MKNTILILLPALLFTMAGQSQDIKEKDVPPAAKTAFGKKFPGTAKVTWEKENGNYEANWGGRSGEDHSAQFSPSGEFVEMVDAIPVSSLPAAIPAYISSHYHAKITEAGKVTNAAGKQTYEVEVKGKDLIFNLDGSFVKKED
jgi:hypothetical protein